MTANKCTQACIVPKAEINSALTQYVTPTSETHLVTEIRVGRFYYFKHTDKHNRVVTYGKSLSRKDFSAQQRVRVMSLGPMFDDELIETYLIPLITQTHTISLRLLDWLMTNYSETHNVMYRAKPKRMKSVEIINLREIYRSWLKSWGKKLFDPFRRRWRLFFDFDGKTYSTTPAQLNFIYCCDIYRIFEFASKHLNAIDKDMNVCLMAARARKNAGRPTKRRRLQKKKCCAQIYRQDHVVCGDLLRTT